MNKKLKLSQNYNETRQLIQAIERRDVNAVDLICKKLRIERSDLLKTLGDEWVIHLSSKEALDWFWLLLMEPEEYDQMINVLTGQAIKLLLDTGCKPNEDFKTIDCDGKHCITFLSQKAQDSLITLVPSEHQQQIHKLFKQPTTERLSLGK